MKGRILNFGLLAVILAYVGLRALTELLGATDYNSVTSVPSPDGKWVITELQSMSEGAHAPYGQHLVLASKAVARADQGHVIFAGYCEALTYQWAGSGAILFDAGLKSRRRSGRLLRARTEYRLSTRKFIVGRRVRARRCRGLY